MPALGKRSEIGMKAEPMMPKPCSMPCICSTFTKASSVVIFIWGIPFPGPGGRAARARRICGARAGARALAYDAAVAGLQGQMGGRYGARGKVGRAAGRARVGQYV